MRKRSRSAIGFIEATAFVTGVVAAMTTALAAVMLATVLLAVLLPGVPAGALVDDPDVDTEATYRYVVVPEDGVVEVTVNLAVTADKPNLNLDDGSFYEYFFDGYFFVIPSEVQGLTVRDDAGFDLAYSVDDDKKGFQILRIEFRRNIFYRQTANVVLTFELEGDNVRSDELARINEAYVGFSVWVDPQLEQASVEVIVPDGFESDSIGIEPFDRQRTEDNNQRFFVEDVDPEDYWAFASLSRESALVSTDLTVDGHDVEIRSWPGDTAWTEFVVDSMENGLPALVEAVGLDWPIEDELAVVESYSPYILGFAGWYDPRINEIEIGDQLNDHVVFHELSHVWFNDGLFNHRWITEGLAEEFAAEVIVAGGDPRPDPPSTRKVHPDALPLNQWRAYNGELEAEEWAYGASWTVTRAIADRIGMDALSEVVQAVANDEISYIADRDSDSDSDVDSDRDSDSDLDSDTGAETGGVPRDWRRYLDLIENRGAVDDDEITELFTEWVLADAEVPLLGDRAVSRESYRLLTEAGDDWAPPLVVRSALTRWQFDVADETMVTSADLIRQRDLLIELVEPLFASLPTGLEAAYEEAEDLAPVVDRMAEVTGSGRALVMAKDKIDGADSLFERVGAIGTDFPADLAAGVGAFEAGDTATANRQAAELDAAVDGLARTGMIRVGAAAGLVLLLLSVTIWWFRRRHQAPPAVATPSFPAT